MKKENILFIGLGLISGSLFKNIVKNNKYNIYIFDTNVNTCKLAQSKYNANIILDLHEIEKIELKWICLGLYPQENVKLILNNLEIFRNQNIFDVAGLQNLWKQHEKMLSTYKISYISTHPMCGREVSGFENSLSNLFLNKNIIINNVSSNVKFLNYVINLYNSLSANTILDVNAQDHDKIVTYTSQLPHVVSLAYTQMLQNFDHEQISQVSSNSFQEFSRISNINEKLWTKLFVDNHEYLVEDIDDLIKNLHLIRNLINDKKSAEIDDYLRFSKKNINIVNKK